MWFWLLSIRTLGKGFEPLDLVLKGSSNVSLRKSECGEEIRKAKWSLVSGLWASEVPGSLPSAAPCALGGDLKGTDESDGVEPSLHHPVSGISPVFSQPQRRGSASLHLLLRAKEPPRPRTPHW